MTAKEMRLAAQLLDMAANEFADHGSNDLDADTAMDLLGGFDKSELIELGRGYHAWNGDLEEFGGRPEEFGRMGDSALMAFMAFRLKQAGAAGQ